MAAAVATIAIARAEIFSAMVMAISSGGADIADIEDQHVLPDEVEIDHHLDEVPGRPGIEADLNIDPGTDEVIGQHHDRDAVDEFKCGDPLGLTQQHRDLLRRCDPASIAAGVELCRLDKDPLIAVVELIGGHGLERLVRRHRRPADPLLTRSPNYPSGAEFRAGIPGPADLLIPEPATVVVHDLAPRRLVVVVPAVLPGLDPSARRIGMPALGGDSGHPDFAVAGVLDEAAILREHAAHFGLNRLVGS